MTVWKLETEALRKEYPGTVALDDVSIQWEAGKVHALLGKNGAGKSTLVKILAGAITPTSGRILLDGAEVRIANPSEAFAQGIVTVHQELSLVPELSVAENILLGRLPMRKKLGVSVVDWPAAFEQARAVLDEMEVSLDVRRPTRSFGVADQQIIEIAKAMSFRPRVLALDEPTSALAHHETQHLFRLIRQLTARGVTVIYISHRLQELKHIADTITVLRDGRLAGRVEMADATPDTIARLLFGEVMQNNRPSDLKCEETPVLEARHIGLKDHLFDVNFTLRRGEILGIAGMLGSGRTELLKALFGAEPFDEGEVRVGGETITAPTPVRMKALGLAFTPEDRKSEALVQPLSIRQNLCMAALERIAPKGLISRSREKPFVEEQVAGLQILISSAERPVASLSGGNQQKVVVGNWLNNQPRIVLFDEPTRGIDVQAKQQIFKIMWDLSRQGVSALFVSSELEELLEVCHRILVLRRGRIGGEVDPAACDFNRLFALCLED
jgi:ribose transport system ATP-binding protein